MSHRKYSLLYPAEQAGYKTLSQTTMHDLGLDQICKKLSAKEAEQNYILNVMARMYADPVVTQYRCDIFEDVLQNKKMRDDMMEILGRISFLKDYGGFKREYDDSASIWDLLHRLDEINDYIKCVDALHTCLADPQLHSAGFLGLREYVEEIYADNGFAELKQDIAGLKLDTSQLKSITVGINLNDRFEADGIGLVSINSKYFTKAGILGNFYEHIAAKDRINADTAWKKDFKFQPFDVNAEGALHTPLQKAMGAGATVADAMVGIVGVPEGDQAKDVTRYTDRIVNHMVSHMVKRAKEVLNKYVSVTITDMTDLIPEMMYYIRWAEYMKKLQDKGFSFAKAVVSQASDQEADRYEMRARGIYNLKLAVFETEESGNIVTNDLDFDKLHRVYVLTGANRGGKTTITQAIGQLFVLAQGGIYIPGSGFTFSPADCIYTHFPADEDKTAEQLLKDSRITWVTEAEFEQQKEALCKELSKWPVYISLDKDVLNKEEAVTDWSQGTMQLSQILCFLTDAKKSGAIFLGMDVCGEQKVSPEGFHLDEENGANLNSSTNEKIKFYQKDLTFSL